MGETNQTAYLRPLIIGHRGAAGEAPENTMASFLLAVEQGCDMIELDVHLTADGKLAVIHDETLDRTTDRKGIIRGKTYAEISEADAGSWFAERFRGERVPLLEEVYEAVPQHVQINVEVKNGYGGAIEPVMDAFLGDGDRLQRTVVSSFDHKLLARMNRSRTDLKIGLLYAGRLIDHAGYAGIMGCPVYSLHPHFHSIDAEDVARAKDAGIAIYPWTANHEADLQSLIDLGVAGIITDFPVRLKRMLEQS
ncbi:glycerophosphodiester phosphodiesterase [Paenibacillus beijingensis]|uniref:glycerophosphodiester phosphodiesterase n=1 Tax=Paenibacillus beijingensis TaxID=1126833 RepID=UPI000B1E70D1|nr:glycerophosphodiester phosphodiesterase family protein [Paenibacillus beijingensis]